MRAECFSGKCIYFGYVVAEPGCGCLGVLHEVIIGVLGDPFMVVWEITITHHMVHDRVPNSCDVFVSLFIDCFVFCFGKECLDVVMPL